MKLSDVVRVPLKYFFHYLWQSRLVIEFCFKKYFWLLKKCGYKLGAVVVILTLFLDFYIGALLLGLVDYFPGNTYAEGYQMGQLIHYGYEGNYLVKAGEAQVLYGANSSGGGFNKGKIHFKNPGALSTTESVYDNYRSLVGDYVLIHYRQVKVQLTTMNGNSDQRILDMVKIDPSKIPQDCGITTNTTGSSRGDGYSAGYLAQVSSMGNLLKSNEAIIQLGNASNQWNAMTISDPAVVECAVAFMQAGVLVKIHYSHSMARDPLTADTTYNIIGILQEVSNPGVGPAAPK